MDRGKSRPLRRGHESVPKRHDTRTPPWERTATMQVPFTQANNRTKTSSTADRHDLPAVWIARSNSATKHIVRKKEQLVQPQRSQSISEGSPIEPRERTWNARQPAPYETQIFAPPSQGSVCRPAHMPGASALSLTPPTSSRGTSPDDSMGTRGQSHHDRDANVHVLPGTMSTRPSVSKCGPRPLEGSREDHDTVAETAPDKFGARLKSTFRAVFKKKATEEDDFVKVGDKHWTEE